MLQDAQRQRADAIRAYDSTQDSLREFLSHGKRIDEELRCVNADRDSWREHARKSKIELIAARESLAKDARRFDWFFGPHALSFARFIEGVREGWTADQWREAIDKEMGKENQP